MLTDLITQLSSAIAIKYVRWRSPINGADLSVARQTCRRRVLSRFAPKAEATPGTAVIEFYGKAVNFRVETIPSSLCVAIAGELAKALTVKNAIRDRSAALSASNNVGFDVQCKASVAADGLALRGRSVAAERVWT